MKRYTPYSFKENEVEKYNRKFVTSHFTAKEADISYKVKEEMYLLSSSIKVKWILQCQREC